MTLVESGKWKQWWSLTWASILIHSRDISDLVKYWHNITVTHIFFFTFIEWKLLSCVQLCNPMDYTLHGILQARILEWVAFPSPGDLPNPRIEPQSPTLQADSLPAEPPGMQTTRWWLTRLDLFILKKHSQSQYQRNDLFTSAWSQHNITIELRPTRNSEDDEMSQIPISISISSRHKRFSLKTNAVS